MIARAMGFLSVYGICKILRMRIGGFPAKPYMAAAASFQAKA
jgi:hypothetical protein